jgi:hypothetical protein
MYSFVIRLIYAITYFIHIVIAGEIFQIGKYGFWPTFNTEESVVEKALDVLRIHYPVLIVLLFLLVAKIIVKGTKNVASYTIQMKSSETYGIEILYTGIQIAPYLTFAFTQKLLGFWGALVLIIGIVFFLVGHGTFNLTLLLLGYRQYKVKTENTTVWLVSKRKISNFSNSEVVYTLQDNVFVRHE